MNQACEHENGLLIHHRIGNVALVAVLRTTLEATPERFPILIGRVLYNGTHCGDFISAADMPVLRAEIASLAAVHCPDPQMEHYLREFEAQIQELVEAAIAVGKPIVF